MKKEEIRERFCLPLPMSQAEAAQAIFEVLREICAQLAELNEHLPGKQPATKPQTEKTLDDAIQDCFDVVDKVTAGKGI